MGLFNTVRTDELANLDGDGLLIEVEIGEADLHTVCLHPRFISIIITKNKEQISTNRFIKMTPK